MSLRDTPADVVRALLRTRTTPLADVDVDPVAPERLLVRSDLTTREHRVCYPSGAYPQAIAFLEQVLGR